METVPEPGIFSGLFVFAAEGVKDMSISKVKWEFSGTFPITPVTV